LIFFFGYVWTAAPPEEAKVFELVAGEGDNYMAREAPALGAPGGVKVEIKQPAAPSPTPVIPVAPEATPLPPVPQPTPPPKQVTPAPAPKTEPPVPNFKKQLVRDMRDIIRGESKAKMQLKKEQDAEKKRLAEEKKKQAEDEKRMTKEEFDRKNKMKTVASASSKNSPVKKIDVDGIAKGVVGGSSNNKVGGAGGKALTNDNDDVLAGYDAIFKQRLRERFESPPGLSDSLKVTIEVRSSVDGTLSGARVVKTSGSNEFDQAVLDAIKRVRMPPRPDKKTETITFVFAMRERSDG
jgi:colicin import membrane protein